MKKIILRFIALMFSMILLGGCGNEGTATSQGNREYFVVEKEERTLATPERNNKWRLLGMQFYEGEILQFWGQEKNEQQRTTWDVYLYREDGSREFLFGQVPSGYRSGWCMTGEGNYFILLGDTIIKMDGEGKEVYNRTYDRTCLKLYQDESGIWLLVGMTAEKVIMLSEIDLTTGELTDRCSFPMGQEMYYAAGQAEGLFVMDKDGVWKLGTSDGSMESVFSFKEMGYELQTIPSDFRVTEDGNVEMLQTGKAVLLKRVNLGETRDVIVLRSTYFHPQIKKYVDNFNVENSAYYVVMEGEEEGESAGALKEKTGIEIATGEGPDIIFVGTTVNNPLELMEKGAFEKLNPYMKQAGMEEADYFPVAFDTLRNGEDIYGISILTQPKGLWISEEFLGGREVPDFETLMDMLLSNQEEMVFWEHWDSSLLLNYLLQASDTLFGIIDWENGTCDFEGAFFRKILEVAKKYGADGKSEVSGLAGRQTIVGFYEYVSLAQRQSEGQVAVGYFFDDGAHVGDNTVYTMAINSNSPCKEGAWAFMGYLLNGEFQTSLSNNEYPVNRSAFEELTQRELEEGSAVKYTDASGNVKYVFKAGTSEYAKTSDAIRDFNNYRANHDLTEEIISEIQEMVEDTRAFPIRTTPILNIISEEAGAYFSDTKSIDDVCKVIQNRVQLYLQEHR